MAILIYLIAVMSAYGNDGHCNWNAMAINTEDPPNSGIFRSYNCLSLTISGANTVQGSYPLIIYVSGDTTISGTIDLDGSNGVIGGIGSFAGGAGGAGGFSGGGVSNFYDTAGNNGGDGGYGGGGQGGGFGSAQVSSDAGGGGGSGGRFGEGVIQAGLFGTTSNTNPSVFAAPGNGGNVPGNNSLSEIFFQNRFAGGTGGGAGGSGDSLGNSASGGTGGGGGGAIRIYSWGDMLVSGIINARGGSGGAGGWISSSEGPGGGGGGGSGGAIYLASRHDITIDGGTLWATPGIGGIGGNGGNTPQGGNGSAGSNGRIRLDDQDGQIAYVGIVLVDPPATALRVHITNESDVSLGCGSIGNSNPPWNGPLSFLIGLILVVLIMGLSTKFLSNRGKFLSFRRLKRNG